MKSTSQPVSPRTIVVTGSSSGIGRATALAFATLGDHVVIHGSRNREGAEQVAKEIANLSPNNDAMVVMADISDAKQCEQLVDEAFQWHGRIDGWIHCAGADVITGSAAKLRFEEKLERLWRVDVQGMIRLSRLVAGRMLTQPQTAQLPFMIHIGWDQANAGMEGDSGEYFCTAKSAVEAFSKSLAKTLAPKVRVNCIAPGWIRTSWGENAHSSPWNTRATGESQLNRWGKPEDVAHAIVTLCDPKNEFIHGQTIAVNGGWQGMNTIPRCSSTI